MTPSEIIHTMKIIFVAAFLPAFAASFTAPSAFTTNNAIETNHGVKSAFAFTKPIPLILQARNTELEAEKKKIIVLGGDGFCGWPTSLHLSDKGHDIVIVDNLSRRNIDTELGCDSLTPIQSPEVCDIRNTTVLT